MNLVYKRFHLSFVSQEQINSLAQLSKVVPFLVFFHGWSVVFALPIAAKDCQRLTQYFVSCRVFFRVPVCWACMTSRSVLGAVKRDDTGTLLVELVAPGVGSGAE